MYHVIIFAQQGVLNSLTFFILSFGRKTLMKVRPENRILTNRYHRSSLSSRESRA